jgi:hypothetical protein
LYEDDGKTLEYQTGSFARTSFSQSLTTSGSDTILTLTINPTNGTYTGKPTHRVYLSEIHLMKKHPVNITVNGITVNEKFSYQSLRQGSDGYFYDTLKHILHIQTPTNPDSMYELRIENVRLTGVLDWDTSQKSYGFRLEQNYPNPFNPFTVIRYHVPQNPPSEGGQRGMFVSLKVYDILGNEITTLVNEKKQSGNHETTWDASSQPSGIYFCKMQTENYLQTQKLVVLK